MCEPMYFNDFNAYLDYVRHFDGDLISPGGAAARCGVTRPTIHEWMYTAKRVRSFIYEGIEGKYILIPISDLDKYWINSPERLKRISQLRRTSSSVSAR